MSESVYNGAFGSSIILALGWLVTLPVSFLIFIAFSMSIPSELYMVPLESLIAIIFAPFLAHQYAAHNPTFPNPCIAILMP